MIFLIIVLVVLFLKLFLTFIICKYKKIHSNVNDSALEKHGATENVNKKTKSRKICSNIINGFFMYDLLLLGFFPSCTVRLLILKYVYQMDIADKVVIHSGFRIRHPWNIHIGKGCVIGDGAYLDGRKGLFIGENVNISNDVCIWTQQHDVNDSNFRCNDKGGPVYIGNRVWLSCRTIILPKVLIPTGTVISAGAVVSKTLNEEYSIYAGIPAKKIGDRSKNLTYEFDNSDSIWFY